MLNKNQLIDILKLSSKTTLTIEDKAYFHNLINSFNKQYESLLFEQLQKHRLEFIFLKHLIETQNIFGVFKKQRIIELSERLAYLQTKYSEYKNEATIISNLLYSYNLGFVWLKGASIIDAIYKKNEIIYRDFGDFDILVSQNQLSKIDEALKEVGFIQGKVDNSLQIIKADRSEILFWHLNSHQEMKYIKKTAFYDISPRLLFNMDVNTTIFWGGKETVPIDTEFFLKKENINSKHQIKTFFTLTPTLELIQLCYHFFKDTQYTSKQVNKQSYNLIKFCDIREYYHKFQTNIDKNFFRDIIEQGQIKEEITFVLKMVSSFYSDSDIQDFLYLISDQNINDVYDWENLLLE